MAILVKLTADKLAATETVKKIVADQLQLYSEWLDTEKLLKKPRKKDGRTHEDLVNEFLER